MEQPLYLTRRLLRGVTTESRSPSCHFFEGYRLLPSAHCADTSLSPMTPDKIAMMQSSLIGAGESPRNIMPNIAVPAAPIPVQTAYPVPTGSVRSESERRNTLDNPAAIVNSAGIKRVKPSDIFMHKANAISRMPATLNNAHAMTEIPFLSASISRAVVVVLTASPRLTVGAQRL